MYIDDRILKKVNDDNDYCYSVYEPANTEVVLGRSSKEEDDVYWKNCLDDNVQILRRRGGGGSVVLTRGVVVISVCGKTEFPFMLREHMNTVNEAIMKALGSLQITGLAIRGISDIALGKQKILGSSLYRRKDIVLYQGSLLVNLDLKLIERYLRHPRKEPDYRQGRTHRRFVTTLWQCGNRIPVKEVVDALSNELKKGPPWEVLKTM
jgi:lipoate-protein ligase A